MTRREAHERLARLIEIRCRLDPVVALDKNLDRVYPPGEVALREALADFQATAPTTTTVEAVGILVGAVIDRMWQIADADTEPPLDEDDDAIEEPTPLENT